MTQGQGTGRAVFLLAVLGIGALPLAGCDSFNRAIGKTRVIPDEFQVVSNAPLAIPPDYALRPPRVNVAGDQSAVDQAKESVFRVADQQASLTPHPSSATAFASNSAANASKLTAIGSFWLAMCRATRR